MMRNLRARALCTCRVDAILAKGDELVPTRDPYDSEGALSDGCGQIQKQSSSRKPGPFKLTIPLVYPICIHLTVKPNQTANAIDC